MRRRSSSKALSPSKGTYANYFEVGHTAFEFVIDFGQTYAGKSSSCHTRIVTSPIYARALLATLTRAVDEHSARFRPGSESAPDNPRSGGTGGSR